MDSGAHRSWHTGAIALLRATGVGAVGLTAGVSQSDGASVKRKMLDSIACAVWVPSFVGSWVAFVKPWNNFDVILVLFARTVLLLVVLRASGTSHAASCAARARVRGVP